MSTDIERLADHLAETARTWDMTNAPKHQCWTEAIAMLRMTRILGDARRLDVNEEYEVIQDWLDAVEAICIGNDRLWP